MKILHFADVHLGVTIYGVLDTSTGLNSRVLDFLDSMDCLCDVAEATKPDLILFAGDAFRTKSPVPTLVTHFANKIQRLADVAPIVMVVGNHDKQIGGAGKRHSIDVMRELKAKNQIYVSASVEAFHFDHSHIVTLPWMHNPDVDTLADEIDSSLDTINDDLPCILLSHADIEGAVYNPSYSASLSSSDVLPLWMFCNECFSYVALGHVHKHQEMCPNVVYCGSLDRVDWGERDDDKGFVMADVTSESTQWRFISVHPRPMLDIQVAWEDIDTLADIDVTDAIVRVLIKSKRSIGYNTALSEVQELLDGYWFLDSVQVVSTEEYVRRRAWGDSVHLESMDPISLLEVYFSKRYPDNKKKVNNLLKHASAIIRTVDEEGIGDSRD